MKGFLIFFLITMVLLGGFLFYKIKHPSDTMIVRTGAYWTIFKHDMNKSKEK